MQNAVFPILFILVFILILFLVIALATSGMSDLKNVKTGMVAGSIGLIMLIGLILFSLFGIFNFNGSVSSSFVPVFGGAWIPIMIAISSKKKKTAQPVNNFTTNVQTFSEKDEIKNIRFCMNCGSQYQIGDRYCEMCGNKV